MAPVVLRSLCSSLNAISSRRITRFNFLGTSSQNLKIQLSGVRNKSTPASASLVHEGDRIVSTDDAETTHDPLDLTFCDHEAAFKSKTSMEILRAILVFQLCSVKSLVDNNKKVKIENARMRMALLQLLLLQCGIFCFFHHVTLHETARTSIFIFQ